MNDAHLAGGPDPGAGAAEMAARLRELSARLAAAAAAAAAASYEAASDPGQPSEVAVTAAGAGRVSRVYVGPRAMRSGAAALAPRLARLMNEAIDGARRCAAQGVDDAAGPDLRAPASPGDDTARLAAELATELAGESASASSPDRKVTVTATGAGTITEVSFGATALRGFDNLTLGEQIAAAANAALDAGRDRAQRRLGPPPGGDQAAAAGLDARLAGFGRRMDELLDQLDQAGRRVTGLE